MKYVIINGSPREMNTWKIVNQVKTNLDGEFEEIHLIQSQIPMCIGCYNCIVESETQCPHFDKVNPIIEKIKKCDGLIITSPVYAMNVTALLKNFFDHTAYFYHRPEFFDKKALVVVSTAGAGHKKVAKYMYETLKQWGFNRVYRIAMTCGGKEHLETEDIDKIAKKFSEDVKSKKLHSPKFRDLIFYNVWRALSQMEVPIKADAEFWESTGLVNYEYSPLVKLNIVKKAFAKIMYFILRKVIK